MLVRPKHITSVGSGQVGSPGATLWTVNVNTAGAGAILKLYNNVSAVAGDLIASIDCGAVGSWSYGVYCEKGIWYDLSVAACDITIGSS